MNNKTFSFNRLGKVLNQDVHDYFSKFSVALYTALGLYILFWLLASILVWSTSALDYNNTMIMPNIRLKMAEGMFILFSIIVVFSVYGQKNTIGEGIHSIMLPASVLEKYLSMAFITIILNFTVMYVAFLTVDSILAALPFGVFHCGTVFTVGDFWHIFWESLWLTFDIQSFFILTNMMFTKHKVGYSILVLTCCCILISIIVTGLISAKTDFALELGGAINNGISRTFTWNGGTKMASNTLDTILQWIDYFLPFIFWGVTYPVMRNQKY